jgi:hypothetical protein
MASSEGSIVAAYQPLARRACPSFAAIRRQVALAHADSAWGLYLADARTFSTNVWCRGIHKLWQHLLLANWSWLAAVLPGSAGAEERTGRARIRSYF